MVFVLSSGVPIPLLSSALDTVFHRFQSPNVSLLSSPVAATVAAGVRSALVVDLGWSETVVTSIYEYREVYSRRSIRAGRLLTEETHHLLAKHAGYLAHDPDNDEPARDEGFVLSFEECEEIASRMLWCRPSKAAAAAAAATATATKETPGSPGLPTVQEDESDEEPTRQASPPPPPPPAKPRMATIPLSSGPTPTSISLSFDQLSEPCESIFFGSQYAQSSFDDHELPIHQLVYRSLLQLPLDVRSVCMARIILTGGCAGVLGLRGRITDEVARMVQQRGWDPVQGKGVERLRANPKLKPRNTRASQVGGKATAPGGLPSSSSSSSATPESLDGVWHDAANTVPATDPIEAQLGKGAADEGAGKGRGEGPGPGPGPVQGEVRVIETVGAWSGASLVSHLKVPAVSVIERELWQQHGAAGASRAGDVDFKLTHRQSLGGSLMRGAGASSAWTLGVWGMT